MGKIQYIQKSRKEHTCGKCRKAIPKGSPYYKGILNFHPDIIRCPQCGLKAYEVTTSDYTRNVGRIVEDWSEDYETAPGVWDDIADALDEIRDEQQERLDNMPEHLQDNSETGQILQERIDALESVIDTLQSCDLEDLLTDAYNELDEGDQQTIDSAGESKGSYDEWYEAFFQEGSEAAVAWKEAFEEKISEFLDNALSELYY